MGGRQGIIAIMGSGETTDSMVRVHRYLLDQLPPPVQAVFIDTPAGFQMNADDLYEKAKEYFARRLSQPLYQVSFKSAQNIPPSEAERAFQSLRQADYIFVGPGSPTYALKNWIQTPIPQIIFAQIQSGACFVAASAAALTIGRFTLPVYEIYKVGEEPHWTEGLDLLGRFGLSLAVIPHWNNAEGGTHDTRFCYMGEKRLALLESMLPEGVPILGVDEHTACLLNFQTREVSVRGVGQVTLRRGGTQKVFSSGATISWNEFATFVGVTTLEEKPAPPAPPPSMGEPFLGRVKSLQDSFQDLLSGRKGGPLADVLLELDNWLWKHGREFEQEEPISQAREVFQGMIVQLGLKLEEAGQDPHSALDLLLKIILDVREQLRSTKQWGLADAIRDKLLQGGIMIDDTPQGPRYKINKEQRAKS